VDGSVQWIKFEKMYFITSWGAGRRGCFYQEDLGPEARITKESDCGGTVSQGEGFRAHMTRTGHCGGTGF
jgi:hypothetical protein